MEFTAMAVALFRTHHFDQNHARQKSSDVSEIRHTALTCMRCPDAADAAEQLDDEPVQQHEDAGGGAVP